MIVFIFYFIIFLSSIYSQQTSGPVPKGVTMKGQGDEIKKWALVIGVNDYNDVGITDLSKARNDAKIIGQILKEQGGFEKVYVMTDDLDAKDPLYPMRVNIELKLDSILDFSSPDDLILFYFSGHGVSDPEGKGYLLPVDTAMDKAFYTSVKVEDIIKRMQDKGIKKSLLILDACRDVLTSSKSSNKQGLQADKYENAEVAATFFSTKAGYYSFEDPKSDFGVFTKALAYGLEGKADMDNDGVISFSELEAYVQNNVSEWSQVNNKKQIPYVKYHREKFGDLPITVRGKREKSLVEENDYGKGDSKLPALWRSALLPGWGQWYDGGKEKAVSFFAIWGILGTYTFQKYNQYQVSEKDYTASSGVPAFAGQGDMLAINYFLIHPKRDEALQKSQNFQLALTGMGLFYVLNLVDISFYKKNEYFWTFHIQVTPDYSNFLNPQRTASFPQHANIFFEYKF